MKRLESYDCGGNLYEQIELENCLGFSFEILRFGAILCLLSKSLIPQFREYSKRLEHQ